MCHTRTLDSSGSRRVQSSSAQLNLVIDRERLLIINPTVQTWCKVVTDIPFWECTEYIRGGSVKAQPWLPAAAANEQPKPQPPYIFAVECSSYFYSLLHLRRALIINTVPGGEISTTDEPPKAPIASQKPIRDIYLP